MDECVCEARRSEFRSFLAEARGSCDVRSGDCSQWLQEQVPSSSLDTIFLRLEAHLNTPRRPETKLSDRVQCICFVLLSPRRRFNVRLESVSLFR